MWRRLIYHPEINYALRQTLVLCLPVAIGLIIGQLHLGLLFSLVPACCNIAGLDTPHKRFFKRLIIGGSLFAGCSLITQLLLARDIPLPLILTGLTLLLGVTAEISPLHARLLPASLIAAIFTLSLGAKPAFVSKTTLDGNTSGIGYLLQNDTTKALYVSRMGRGISELDVTTATSPVMAASDITYYDCYDVKPIHVGAKGYLFIAGRSGLAVVDLVVP